eukprot:GHUV01034447.1.p1 GENE.GHUV01034447.1~~GHUV01034447.1.p1  ORF type:complete len:106 (-),score=8.48 GHUV01034447.1:384-701(-)
MLSSCYCGHHRSRLCVCGSLVGGLSHQTHRGRVRRLVPGLKLADSWSAVDLLKLRGFGTEAVLAAARICSIRGNDAVTRVLRGMCRTVSPAGQQQQVNQGCLFTC